MTAFERAWDLIKYGWCEECGNYHYESDEQMMEHIRNPFPQGEMELDNLWEDREKDCEQKLRQAIGEIVWGTPYEYGNGFEDEDETRNPFYENQPLPLYDLQQLLNYLKFEIPSLMNDEYSSPIALGKDMMRALVNYYECMGMPIPAEMNPYV